MRDAQVRTPQGHFCSFTVTHGPATSNAEGLAHQTGTPETSPTSPPVFVNAIPVLLSVLLAVNAVLFYRLHTLEMRYWTTITTIVNRRPDVDVSFRVSGSTPPHPI